VKEDLAARGASRELVEDHIERERLTGEDRFEGGEIVGLEPGGGRFDDGDGAVDGIVPAARRLAAARPAPLGQGFKRGDDRVFEAGVLSNSVPQTHSPFIRIAGRVWYDDQREVHRQIFDGDETVDYAFMGQDPDAPDNRWLREAYENNVPVIYFLGVAPGRYEAMIPVYVAGWDPKALKARVAFGVPDQPGFSAPESATERRYALRIVKQRLHQGSVSV